MRDEFIGPCFVVPGIARICTDTLHLLLDNGFPCGVFVCWIRSYPARFLGRNLGRRWLALHTSFGASQPDSQDHSSAADTGSASGPCRFSVPFVPSYWKRRSAGVMRGGRYGC